MARAESKEVRNRCVRANVSGIVQGVGFRPFIYQLAHRYNLKGYITNTSDGVDIEIEGANDDINSFFSAIRAEPPPLARIMGLRKLNCPWVGYREFTIQRSRTTETKTTLISPDVCICDQCLSELADDANRRYRYPFINCTNCGPRYTIIQGIPYDRPQTSMKSFPMCHDCAAEYHDPLNRRFHAEPNACWHCGPQVQLFDARGQRTECKDPIAMAADLLRQGKILAIKGLGGFHVAVDATQDEAVRKMRRLKQREEKPLALMSLDINTIETYARVNSSEERLLMSRERPIVLLRKKCPNPISPEVAPRSKHFGVMIPYTPLHYLLFKEGAQALVMTSGNPSGEPIIIHNAEALGSLGKIADYLLVHNRDIYMRCDDSVVRVIQKKKSFIRRARGYVPVPVMFKEDLPEILACGAELKNTVCLTKGRNAFLSQHIGDLENLETLESFSSTIDHLKDLLEINPSIIAHDLHPEYLSTKYALSHVSGTKHNKALEIYGVQHHHAHIVSCMAENHLHGPVIGLAMDGTGYGTDGAIWGGEILISKWTSFIRAGHLEYAALPGGAAAIKEPWRMAASYLYQAYGGDFLSLGIPFIEKSDPKALSLVATAIQKGINTFNTSSCGRLFDGVSALLGIKRKIAYEGQAAIELEMSVRNNRAGSYDYAIERTDGKWIVGIVPIVHQIVADIKAKTDSGIIAGRFHDTLAVILTDLCLKVRDEWNINKVVLSGGVFQNVTLQNRLIKYLKQNDFRIYSHRLVPSNDGGLSLGQAIVAYALHTEKGSH